MKIIENRYFPIGKRFPMEKHSEVVVLDRSLTFDFGV